MERKQSMTLKEFVQKVMTENNITGDANKIIENITDIARERAKGEAKSSCVAISDEEIREMVINNADLVNKAAAEKKLADEKIAQMKAEEVLRKKQEKAREKEEKERVTANGEQTSLF